jgi:hypothetical protein
LKPVPSLNKERELLEDAAQEAILEDQGVGSGDNALVAEELQLATAQSRLLMSGKSGRRAVAAHEAVARLLAAELIGSLVVLVPSPS